MRVDSHHHFWNPGRRDYYWMEGEAFDSIRRPFGPEDLRPWLQRIGIDKTIVCQTIPSVDETREFLALAETTDFVGGVIGWVPLQDPDVDNILASLKAGPGGQFLKAIRHQVHDEADPLWLNRPDVMTGVRAVGRAGLAYDLLPKEPQLPACIRCVAENPDMRFVVDHIAKPRIAAHELQPWAGLMRELAAYPNVWCKISGMVTEADMSTWREDDFRPYVERVLEFYGEDRVLFGSDWPVCLLASESYEAVHRLAETLLSSLSPAARAKAFGSNAQVVYCI